MHPSKFQNLQCQHILSSSSSLSLSVSSLSFPLLTTFRTEDDRSGFIFSQAHFVNFCSCTRIFSHLASLRPSLGTFVKIYVGNISYIYSRIRRCDERKHSVAICISTHKFTFLTLCTIFLLLSLLGDK